MRAREFKAWARDTLSGHWGAAIGVALVAALLMTGFDMVTPLLQVNMDTMEITMGEGGLLNAIPRQTWAMMVTITVVSSLVSLVLGGAVNLGLSTHFLNLVNRREAKFGDLFSHFNRLWAGFCMRFIMTLFIGLWSLLFVIPGVIAAYSYAMVPYLMAEFPDLKVMDAIRESKRLMRGNKGRLFFLHLSFIGWNLLSALTMGILGLWVSPYMIASEAAFYMDVTGRSQSCRQQAQPLNPAQDPWGQGPEF